MRHPAASYQPEYFRVRPVARSCRWRDSSRSDDAAVALRMKVTERCKTSNLTRKNRRQAEIKQELQSMIRFARKFMICGIFPVEEVLQAYRWRPPVKRTEKGKFL